MARYPTLNNGIPQGYHSWEEYDFYSEANSKFLIPIGYGGILYPPKALYKDVIKDDLFLKLSPKADDLWFWFCGILNNTHKRCIKREIQIFLLIASTIST